MPPRRPPPTGLDLSPEQLEVFDELSGRRQRIFDAIAENQVKLGYLQALVDKKVEDKEKSVCLFKRRYIFVINFH